MELSTTASGTITLLSRLTKVIHRRTPEELLGMRLRQFIVLSYLAERGRVSQQELGDALCMDANNLVLLLNETEGARFVQRRRDPSDRRRHTVTLTAAGARELEHVRTIVERIQDDFLAPLDEAGREQLFELLSRLARYHDSRFAPAEGAAA